MNKITGNLIELGKKGDFDVIIHGCNCFCAMGAGIALSIKNNFPTAYEADLATEKGAESKLGTFSFASIEFDDRKLIVVNVYTQYHWKGRGVKVNYEALRTAFKAIKHKFTGLKIGYPAIGSGLAGGDWSLIAQIISEELHGENHTFVEFDKNS
jgi:O-acetyl-ADP-ribose deacetylase (regulator of RNase III)